MTEKFLQEGEVEVGDRRVFHSSLQGEDSAGILVRLYTGQEVDVIAPDGAHEETNERLFTVKADDGTEFAAWETELIPHAQSHYVTPDGEWHHDPDFGRHE